tara:strand:- start:158 stop:1003 length:846 start_codon:yes stop_codon:yes gene_type:complete
MIRACIFDLGGTIVDKYSLTPFLSLKGAFALKNINVFQDLLQKDMGLKKIDHIDKILKDKKIIHQWEYRYGKVPDENDKYEIYDNFHTCQLLNQSKDMEVIPQTYKCLQKLKNNNIKIGITTGFSKPIMNDVIRLFDLEKYIDSNVSSTCFDDPGRPHPFMIYKNMEYLNIDDPKHIIKIDDTCVGIQEGKNAGCWTVGVARWSVNMEVTSIDELNNMNQLTYNEDNRYGNYRILRDKIDKSKDILRSENPDFVIQTLEGLPDVIKMINNKMKNNESFKKI